MIDVRRTFSKLVFAQIMLGTLAFCLASRDMGMLLIVGVLGTVAWFVVERRGGKPMPQWIVGSGAIVASAWLVLAIFDQRDEPVRAMGNFILWLQLLLLFGKKSNREYGELLVLSLMLMIGATTINQAVVFGVLLVVYYTLALFTLLTFQFKVLADRVARLRAADDLIVDEPVHAGPVGVGFRWQFRTLALTMGIVAACVGVMVFLSLPRTGGGYGRNNQLASMQRPEVDFADQINLDAPPPEVASREPVMNLRVMLDGEPYGSSGLSHLVRGAVLDRYDVVQRTWSTDLRVRNLTERYDVPPGGRQLVAIPPGTRKAVATFTFRSRSPRQLFTLFPAASFESGMLDRVSFNRLDQTLEAADRPDSAIEYTVTSPLIVPSTYYRQVAHPAVLDPARGSAKDYWWGRYAPVGQATSRMAAWVWSPSPGPTRGYHPSAEEARQAWQGQLSQVDEPNSLLEFWKLRVDAIVDGARNRFEEFRMSTYRGTRSFEEQLQTIVQRSATELLNADSREWQGYAKGWPVDEAAIRALGDAVLVEQQVDRTSDVMIARALSNYVRDNHTYSLANNHDTAGRDPTVAFLFDHRLGHCELFASGLAAMARAQGMRARVVTGYLASEYVPSGGYYIVRKSDAHAWTEIYCQGVGWRVFDPTPSAEVLAERAASGDMLSWLTDLYDHIEFAWIGSVITYDSRTRSSIFDSVNQSFNDTFLSDESWLAEGMTKLDQAITEATVGGWSARLALIGVGLGALAMLYFFYRILHWLLTYGGRDGQQDVFAAQVRFYPQMLQMLAAIGHPRPSWQTPLAFAESLAARDVDRFAPVQRLTRQFYELHYGGRDMDDSRRAAIKQDMAALKSMLRQQLPESQRPLNQHR